MSTWGVKAWETDIAADWFSEFGQSINYELLGRTIDHFDINDEFSIEEMRAACYVLETFGKTYIWAEDFDILDRLLEKAIDNLEQLLASQDYMSRWTEEDAFEAQVAIEEQLANLRANLEG